MDKITIELDREIAEDVKTLLGAMNYYFVGAALCACDIDFDDADVERINKAVTRMYARLETAMNKL